jgi:cytochrome b561
MALAASRQRYSAVAQILHWATAIVVVAAFIYGPGGSEQRVYSVARDLDRQIHETLGLSVLLTTLLRLGWRAYEGVPAHSPMPSWMRVSSSVVHVTLYVLLLVLPLTAISGAWLEGHPLTLLAGIRIGPWLAEAHSTGSAIATIHTWLGDTILWVAGLHAVAGLYHHFVLRDSVLQSMLPF